MFADRIASSLFEQQCKAVKSTAQVLRDIAAAEPKAVADMSADERQVALLSHLCYMSELWGAGLPLHTWQAPGRRRCACCSAQTMITLP